MIAPEPYKARQFNLSGLNGISDRTMEMHFKLYEGYVTETNKLSEKIADFLKDGQVDQEEMPLYSELKRRLGFEFNGMILHEYYFENLKKGAGGDPVRTSSFYEAAEASFGSYATGKRISLAPGRCGAWAGRCATSTQKRAVCRITGSVCIRPERSPVLILC
jgi:superoxide dismutase